MFVVVHSFQKMHYDIKFIFPLSYLFVVLLHRLPL